MVTFKIKDCIQEGNQASNHDSNQITRTLGCNCLPINWQAFFLKSCVVIMGHCVWNCEGKKNN